MHLGSWQGGIATEGHISAAGTAESALGWLLFTVTIQFWAAVIACYVSAAVLRKLYFTLSGRTKNPLAFLSHPLWEKPDKPSESV